MYIQRYQFILMIIVHTHVMPIPVKRFLMQILYTLLLIRNDFRYFCSNYLPHDVAVNSQWMSLTRNLISYNSSTGKTIKSECVKYGTRNKIDANVTFSQTLVNYKRLGKI